MKILHKMQPVLFRCWLFISCEGGKKTEACKSGPRARVPRQGDYSRPHQSQEIVKPTPFRLMFIVLFSSSVLVICEVFCVHSVLELFVTQ